MQFSRVFRTRRDNPSGTTVPGGKPWTVRRVPRTVKSITVLQSYRVCLRLFPFQHLVRLGLVVFTSTLLRHETPFQLS